MSSNKNYKKKKWNKIIMIIAIIVGIFFTGVALVYATTYFYKNQLLFPISEKYNTTEFNDLKSENDTIFIQSAYDLQHNMSSNDSLLIVSLLPKTYDILKINTTVPFIKKDVDINKESSAKGEKNLGNYYIIKKNKESFQLGDIGDFLGGYFGVLLGFAGIAFTFIAFWVQYMANVQVQDQFKLQQFENQFQKMIDVYLNNKDKFSIIGYKNPDNLAADLSLNRGTNLLDNLKSIHRSKTGQSGTSYFVQPNPLLLTTTNNRIFIDYITKDQIVFQKMLVELKSVYRVFLEAYKEKSGEKEKDLSNTTKKELFSLAYKTFFNGLNKFSKQYSEDDTITFIDKNIVKYSFSILEELRSIYKLDGTKAYKNFYKDHDDKWKTLWLKVNYEPFKGYLHFLPQYYRNLYTIVKFVVNDNADLKLDDEDKLKYLRILRSTLSDYEQTMLFYNWYSGIGDDWENNNNKFLSKYKMIHNMKKITLIDSEIDIFTILGISPTADFFENY